MKTQYPQMFSAAASVLLLLLLLGLPISGVTLLERIVRSTRAVFDGTIPGYGPPKEGKSVITVEEGTGEVIPTIGPVQPLKALNPPMEPL